MRLLRTIRLDPSDNFVFDKAAEPGEWAVPGGFVFANAEPEKLASKARVAFRSGLLGIDSLGWSTLVQIVEASEADRAEAIAMLADRLIKSFGAPNLSAAQDAAAEEIEFAASLCGHPPGTLIAMHRVYEDGAIRETFRTLRPREGAKPLRAFAFLEVEGDDEPQDGIALVDLAREPRG